MASNAARSRVPTGRLGWSPLHAYGHADGRLDSTNGSTAVPLHSGGTAWLPPSARPVGV